MSPQALVKLLLVYTVALILLCLLVYKRVALDPTGDSTGVRIVSIWHRGERVQRAVVKGDARATLSKVCSNCTRVVEAVVDQAPLFGRDPFLLSISLVPGRDGLKVELGERSFYLTPLDLLQARVNRGKSRFGRIQLQMGFDNFDHLLDLAAKELNVARSTLLSKARLERFIVRREDKASEIWPRRIEPNDVTAKRLDRAIGEAGRYLASTVRTSGRFVYEIDARTGKANDGYNWPRHAGSTYFLAEAAHLTGDKTILNAAKRAADHLRYRATLNCGVYSCVGEGLRPDLGSSALALLAYAELERHGLLSRSFMQPIRSLAAHLRRMQRPDGEFMHIYDRGSNTPVDVQFQYYTGEAAFALARAYRVTDNEQDLAAARAALSYLVDKSWNFFGSRYFFRAEHWTCQALDDLWDRAPDRQALRFCLDFHAFNREGQFDKKSSYYLYDGGIGANPFFPPRFGVTGSRTEAAVATLTTAVRADIGRSDTAILEEQIRRSLAYILRYQFLPGPTYLMANPESTFGAILGSPVDWRIRNDFVQHAGSAMVRFSRYLKSRQPR